MNKFDICNECFFTREECNLSEPIYSCPINTDEINNYRYIFERILPEEPKPNPTLRIKPNPTLSVYIQTKFC